MFFHYYWWPLSWHFPAAIYCKPNISLPSGSESIRITFEFHLCPHAIPYTHLHFLFHLTAQLLITETSSWGSLHLASSFPPRTKLPQLFLLQDYSSYIQGWATRRCKRRGGFLQSYCHWLASSQQQETSQHSYCSVIQCLEDWIHPSLPWHRSLFYYWWHGNMNHKALGDQASSLFRARYAG